MPILSRPEAKRQGPPRRWRVLRAPSPRLTPYEGCDVLDELPDCLGLELWRFFRDVLLWAEISPETRRGLFRDSPPSEEQVIRLITVAPLLGNSLQNFHHLLRHPERSDPARVGRACHEVSEWAAERGYLAIREAFAEAAAYVVPNNGEYALDAGLAARHRGAFGRADHWYRRGLSIARRDGDHPTHVVALIRRGVLEELRGKVEQARSLQTRAWRAAKRFKLRKLAAYAQHELLILSITTQGFEDAQQHAALACELYGRLDDRFPQLAHDVAFMWAWHGYFDAALPVYEAVLPYVTNPSERIQLIANIGRAAAAAGDAERFFDAWEQVRMYEDKAAEWKATAFLALAHGAASLRLPRQARRLAADALAAARARNLTANENQVLQFIAELQARRGKDRNGETPAELDRLRVELVRRLTMRRRGSREN